MKPHLETKMICFLVFPNTSKGKIYKILSEALFQGLVKKLSGEIIDKSEDFIPLLSN